MILSEWFSVALLNKFKEMNFRHAIWGLFESSQLYKIKKKELQRKYVIPWIEGVSIEAGYFS